ncbi:MAG: RtcB family protein [Alphaproteobacteria bacterium]|nr:RtcB family protein [Alphaproteobacteria bacterium]
MKEIVGKYNKAKVFTDIMDNTSIEQIKTLCDQEFTQGSLIRIMPDVHAGAGCTIGTTMTIKNKIVPNLVGVDIGCGMATCVLKEKDIDLQKLDKFIYSSIPAGMNIRETPHKFIENIDLESLRCISQINKNRAIHSMGTLGGGNHFIEVSKDDEGYIYLVVHSGSRNLGKQVAEYYQEEAYKHLNKNSSVQIEETIQQLKKEGKHSEIEKTVNMLKSQHISNIPKALAYVEGKLFDNYIHDMKIVQQYATYNRKAMIEDIINALNINVEDSFTTIHNYIDTEAMILRKGSVSAKAGEKLLIPINMRDGSLICIGKGNPDWNYSAPHGAGRLYSRIQAKKIFNIEEFKRTMEGIYTTSINNDTLDECPMAYKNMDDIVKNITPTAEIVKIIKPIYNFKAGETTNLRRKK